jgi:hypothetical protein
MCSSFGSFWLFVYTQLELTPPPATSTNLCRRCLRTLTLIAIATIVVPPLLLDRLPPPTLGALLVSSTTCPRARRLSPGPSKTTLPRRPILHLPRRSVVHQMTSLAMSSLTPEPEQPTHVDHPRGREREVNYLSSSFSIIDCVIIEDARQETLAEKMARLEKENLRMKRQIHNNKGTYCICSNSYLMVFRACLNYRSCRRRW